MRLIDAIQQLESFDPEATIYGEKPWTEGSQVVVASEPEAGGLPDEALRRGFDYFLEVFVAQEFLEDWRAGLSAEPTLQEQCRRLIQYAVYDA